MIGFRLPLANYAVLERKAASAGRTVAQHVRAVMIRSTADEAEAEALVASGEAP